MRRATQLPPGRLPLFLAERRTFLLLGTAQGHVLRGDRSAAAMALLDAEQAAPEEMRRNPRARALLAGLLQASPVRSQPLRELAARMDGTTEVAAGWPQ